jgi:hypothetical protein
MARALTRSTARHEVTDREIASRTGAVPQHVSQWRDPDAAKSLSCADAMALPEPVLVDVVEHMLPGFVVARIPDAGPRASIAHAIEMQREASEALAVHLLAIADGTIDRGEGAALRERLLSAMRAFAAVLPICDEAIREGSATTAEVH